MSAAPQTYGELLERNAAQHGAEPALLGEAPTLSHAELLQRCQAMAAALAASGVAPGEGVALLAGNRTEVMVLLGACALRGALLVPLNTRTSAAEVANLVADLQPRLLLCEPEFEALLGELPGSQPCHGLGGGDQSARLGRWPQTSVQGPLEAVAVDAQAPLVGIPTAAVGGRPRIALLSHRALLHQAGQLAQAWSLRPQDRHLCVLPLYHTAGLGLALAAQVAGGASVLVPRFNPAQAAADMGRWHVSFFASFAPMLGALLDAADAAGLSLASLRHVTGLEPQEVLGRLNARCPQATFWSAYGQTETAGMVSLGPQAQRPGAAGRPLPGAQLRIDSPAPEEAGEILVRGDCVFSGYWKLPAESAHAARGGWHHTGDLGRIDEQGFLWFTGRAPDKALIKSGGENIYPAEVEQALLAHPAVEAAVVFGVPDARWGEAPRAVCVLRPGRAATGEELAEFVATRIARFKRPREVVLVPDLPRLADGAWDRAAIRTVHGG